MKEIVNIAPQKGPQTEFLSTTADIAIFGGAAGSGKSFGLLLEPLRHYDNPKFGGVIFRRQATQVRNEGGLWQESQYLYPLLGGRPREMNLEWTFPSKARMKFAHLEHEKTVLEWQGAQIPFIGFDELTHFTEDQFFYMMSRNRSTSGVRAYIRATCNADSDSWVRKFIDWWIGEDGFPIKERSGKIRWFVREGNHIMWADTKEELIKRFGPKFQPKSVTFISALLQDNKILMEKDPGYLSNLLALNRVERERLLLGNWNVRPSSGNFFRKEWFKVLPTLQNCTVMQQIRFWDRASTVVTEMNKDPDYTAGLHLVKLNTGIWVITDIVRFRGTPSEVEKAMQNTASRDGYECYIGIEQDPGSAGVADVDNIVKKLPGYMLRIGKPTKKKEVRASPVSAQCEHGNVYLLKGSWNDAFFTETENFPEGSHDDQVDALSGAFNELAQGGSILDVL